MNYSNSSNRRLPTHIETERLVLRTPRIEDAFALLELAKVDAVFAHATFGDEPRTLESTCTAIARMLADARSGAGAWWVVEEKSDHSVVGLSGYTKRARSAGPINALAAEVVGRGYATETVEALLTHGSRAACLHGLSLEMTDSPKADATDSATRWYWHNKSARPTRARRCA